jgi:homocysteine S-methyltransferase
MPVELFEPFIKKCGLVILDGAMATELERRGADLNNPLWSAKLLIENPSLIKQVHLDYLKAGADIITTSSYQASIPGFDKQGYSKEKAVELLLLSTHVATEAREEALKLNYINGPVPLIAASIGPYGAFLADGSEYRGNYSLSVEELMEFHRERIRILSGTGADLLACETIPCPEEAIAIMNILKEFPSLKVWISFSCKNESEVCDGSSFAACVDLTNQSEQVVAVGINCTAPQYAESLIRIARASTEKHILAYPNKGEVWDPGKKCWLPGTNTIDFEQAAPNWYRAGATLIGGCCRSTPSDIKKLKTRLCNR